VAIGVSPLRDALIPKPTTARASRKQKFLSGGALRDGCGLLFHSGAALRARTSLDGGGTRRAKSRELLDK
jgi:hypothetical protein